MNKIKKTVAVAVFASLSMALFSNTASYGATTLTTAQKQQLQYIVEEEKLARDVYNYLAANVTSQKFSNIARSEQTHMDQITAILKTYKIWNPTTNRAPGVFKNTELQKLYNDLVARGSAGTLQAFEVGKLIEVTDIDDLQVMLKSTWPADAKATLDLLLRGSQNHLAAFSR